ncbi:MAG: hypothetical protein QOG20_3039 [Pseudonocardiales bacterium]|nr:hypothetical protein [Pseudonocardiales bacterium]
MPAKAAVFGRVLLLAFAGAWGAGRLSDSPDAAPAAAMEMSGMEMSGMSTADVPQGLQVAKHGYAVRLQQDIPPAGEAVPFRVTMASSIGRRTPCWEWWCAVWSRRELVDMEAGFWVELGAGKTLQAACDAVGVDRRTGRRWRRVAGARHIGSGLRPRDVTCAWTSG